MRPDDNRRLFHEAGLDQVRPPATHGEFRAFVKAFVEQSTDAFPGSHGLTEGASGG